MILFTADLHIKLGQKNVPKDWALKRYGMFTEQSTKIPHSLHIMGGDVFDRVPSVEELAVYFSLILAQREKTIIFDGNHEATKKNQTFFTLLADATHALNNKVTVVTESTTYDDFSILPYADLHKAGSIEKLDSSLPLFTHVRGEIPPHVKPEVDLDRFANFPIVYAGDLHSHSNSQRNIIYPGSPMTTSFHRKRVKTGYLLIDPSDLTKWTWEEFDLPQLIRETVTSPDDMVPTDFDHTIYEIEGDLQSLSTVANTELLDKKIIKRASEVSINLADKSIEEELATYLEEILQIEGDALEATMEVFNAYSTRS
jgi:hypothetical protein